MRARVCARACGGEWWRRRGREIDGRLWSACIFEGSLLETVEVCIPSYSDASAPSDTDCRCAVRSAKIGFLCRAAEQLTAPNRTMRLAAVRSSRER